MLDSAELEMTVALLVQIDKLVMLIESPVFTCKPAKTTGNGVRLTVKICVSSSAITTARTGKISLLVQVSLRTTHAVAAKQRIRLAAQSAECCQLDGLLAHSQAVSLDSHRYLSDLSLSLTSQGLLAKRRRDSIKDRNPRRDQVGRFASTLVSIRYKRCLRST
jgi:hypothetical protein